MQKILRIICGLLLTAIASFSVNASVLSLPDRRVVALSSNPIFVQKMDSSGVTMSCTIPTIEFTADSLYAGSYWCVINNFGITSTVGTPSLPQRFETFELPVGVDSATVSIMSYNYSDFIYEITPSRPLLLDSDDSGFSKQNVIPVRQSVISSANNIIKIVSTDIVKGRKRVVVKISPIQYELSSRKVRVFHDFKFKLHYVSGSEAIPVAHSRQSLNTIVASSGDGLEGYSAIPAAKCYQKDTTSYLVLTVSKYLTSAKKFVNHKKEFGFQTYLCSKSSWTSQEISDTIRKYGTIENNLQYVLLIGGHKDLPSTINVVNHSGDEFIFPSDYPYSCLDGDDDKGQDLQIGRILINNLMQCENVVDKLIQHQLNPPTEESYYKNCCHASFFQTAVGNCYREINGYIRVSEMIRQLAMSHGKQVQRIYTASRNAIPKYWVASPSLLPEDLRIGFDWKSANKDTIIRAINNGNFYVFHRDHGDVDAWVDPSFTSANIGELSNAKLLPVVLSINCLTGRFHETNPCFAEQFLTHTNGGCSGIIAATESTYTVLNNQMAPGMFEYLFGTCDLDSIEASYEELMAQPVGKQLGTMLCAGMDVLSKKATPENTHLLNTQYHVFGDPSMYIHTETPTEYTDEEFNISQKVGRFGERLPLYMINIHLPKNEVAYCAVFDHESQKVSRYKVHSMITLPTNLTNSTVTLYGTNRMPKQLTTADAKVPTPTFPGLIVPIRISSNPSNMTTTVYYSDVDMDIVPDRMTVVSLSSGQIEETISLENISMPIQLDTSKFNAGTYVIHLYAGDVRIGVEQLVVVH